MFSFSSNALKLNYFKIKFQNIFPGAGREEEGCEYTNMVGKLGNAKIKGSSVGREKMEI